LRGLADISYGVMAARKGWLEANDVLNTLTAEQLSAMI
jgi:histidinol phosphatase-like PHP family hydrolase